MKRIITTLVIAAAVAVAASAASAQTLKAVKERGTLICGFPLDGFNRQDGNGNWIGLDMDFCRAVAAAIFAREYPDRQDVTPLLG